MTVAQVREGLKAGSIYLAGDVTKTKRSRSLSVTDNCRKWLEQFLPQDGNLVPAGYNLDSLGPDMAR